MDFNLSKEQELLRDGLGRFLSTRYDLEKSRAAAKTGAGWQPDIWRGFADELGILGAALPEEVAGIGGGPVEVMLIAEALGHALVVETVRRHGRGRRWVAASAGGPTATALLEKWLPVPRLWRWPRRSRASGENWRTRPPLPTVTATMGCCADPDRRDRRAIRHPPVDHGAHVGDLAVPRRNRLRRNGSRCPQLVCRRRRQPASSRQCVPADALLGEDHQALARNGPRRRRGGDLRRGGRAACGRCSPTPSNMQQRQQFGQPIAAFRRCSTGWSTCTWKSSRPSPRCISRFSTSRRSRRRARQYRPRGDDRQAARFVGQQAVQLHGGMGMTEELAIGHYFKRLTAFQYESARRTTTSRYAEMTKA